jgi:pectin methylesterase-like acyl-CoA thioesterase
MNGNIKHLVFGVFVAFVLLAASVGVASASTWYVDDDLADYPNANFTRIQDAVSAANAGDTIIVYRGTYTENVDVNKDRLTIKSENGAEKTIVQAVSCCFKIYLSCPKEG